MANTRTDLDSIGTKAAGDISKEVGTYVRIMGSKKPKSVSITKAKFKSIHNQALKRVQKREDDQKIDKVHIFYGGIPLTCSEY